mgnify:CR=1 FL=1
MIQSVKKMVQALPGALGGWSEERVLGFLGTVTFFLGLAEHGRTEGGRRESQGSVSAVLL